MPSLITRGYGRFTSYQTGTISLDSNKWMNIAVPVKGRKIKEYFVDKVLEIVRVETPTATASDIFEVLKAFPASDESVSKYLVYVPDITPNTSPGNFNLVTTDGTKKEINGFLCKTKDYSNVYSSTLEFDWTTEEDI